MFFHKIAFLLEDSLTKQIFLRRLFFHQHKILSSKTLKQHGFIPDLIRILSKYKSKSYLERFMKGIQLPVKMCWKCVIDESVRKYEKQMLTILNEKDQDFIRYQQIHTSQN